MAKHTLFPYSSVLPSTTGSSICEPLRLMS
jgi:hypothetical protein